MRLTVQELVIEGIERCKQDQFQEAITLFDQALSAQPMNEKALYNRAKAHFKIKNFDQSIQDFNMLLQQHPTNAYYYSERAVAHHLGGDSLKAIDDLDKAAEIEPMKPFRYSSRAFIKDHMGDLEGAIADYEKAIELDPEDAISYNNKGLVEEKMGYRDRSKRSFEKADALDPKKLQKESYSPVKEEQTVKKEEVEIKQPTPQKVLVDLPEIQSKKEKKSSLSFTTYIRQVKAIVNDKNERGAFNEFIRQFFSRKN